MPFDQFQTNLLNVTGRQLLIMEQAVADESGWVCVTVLVDGKPRVQNEITTVNPVYFCPTDYVQQENEQINELFQYFHSKFIVKHVR